MAINRNYVLGGVAATVVAVAAVFALQKHPAPPAPAIKPPALVAPAPAIAPAPAPAPEPPCAPPANSPPAPPDGSTATADDMRQGHDAIQAYVKLLEDYQSCLDAYADHAAPTVSVAQKQSWIDQGNGAVDEANLLAKAFSVQIQAYKAKNPDH